MSNAVKKKDDNPLKHSSREIGIRSLRIGLPEAIRRAKEEGPLIVTKNGKPVAIIQAVDGMDLGEALLVTSKKFRHALASVDPGKSRPLSELKGKLS